MKNKNFHSVQFLVGNNRRTVDFELYPKYFSINKHTNKLNIVANAEKCDFIILRKNELQKTVKEGGVSIKKAVTKFREWLTKKYPGNDWKMKISKNGNYNFWKSNKKLKAVQNDFRMFSSF